MTSPAEYSCLVVEDRNDVKIEDGPLSKTPIFLAATVSPWIGCLGISGVLRSGMLAARRTTSTRVVKDCARKKF